MQSMEVACDDGEHAVKRLKALKAAIPSVSCSKDEGPGSYSDSEEKQPRFDILEELGKLYDEEDNESNSSDSEDDITKGVQYRSLILETLVKREHLNTIIFNLYPGNKGYSMAFRVQDKRVCVKEGVEEMIETKMWPYEDGELLRYLDKEELPPFMIDVLEQFEYLFYSGCIIAEVRDYRKAYPNTKCYYTHHILLRPTQKTLLADINNLTKDETDFTTEDKDYLESQLLLAHTPDLCLEPDSHIENDLARIYNRRHLWNSQVYWKIARKYSQATVNKKRKLDQYTHRHGLELFEFTRAKKRKAEAQLLGHSSRTLLKKSTPEDYKTVIPIPNLECKSISPPSQPVVVNGFKPMSWPPETDDCSAQLMEEYILETDMPSKDKDNPRVYHIKLSIFHRPSSFEFLGELYLDRDHKKDEGNGVSCRFSLGSRPNAHRYVQQFTEIFTECGRKVARIRGSSARSEMHIASRNASQPQPREQVERLSQALQAQTQHTQVGLNGVQSVQMPHHIQTGNVQNLQQLSTKELKIKALETELMNSGEQFQAAAKAKQAAEQQQQKFLPNIINLLNSSPANSSNSEASAAVVNALSNGPHQRLLARKMTLSNVSGGARVINHSNLIALNNSRVNLSELNAQLSQAAPQTVTLTSVNNNRVNLGEFNAHVSGQQPQTVTLTSVGSGGSYNYTTVPVKQQVVNQRILSTSSSGETGNKSALSAMLVGTPAADVPDIVSPSTNSLLLEKLAGGSGQNPFAQAPKPQQQTQFVVQNPKGNTVISPMSSPPSQASGALNVQSLNLAQLQSLSGLQNVQVQLPGSTQLISLALNVSGQVSGGAGTPTGLLVSLPAGVATQTQAVATQGSQQTVQGVVLNAASSSQIAHLVSSGSIKNISQQNIRSNSGSQTVQLTQGNQQFQLFSQIQRPNRQQNLPTQANITSRTPITIKMAPNSNQRTLEAMQHYQQLCVNQQKNLGGVLDKLRRPSGEPS